MKEYLLACEAIRDLSFFKGPADLTRWDLFFVTREDDVSQEEINLAVETPLTIPADVQRRHSLWAWSRRQEQIILSDETLDRVNKATSELVETYGSESLAIVHRGYREVMIRLTVALAATVHSVDPSHEKIIVKPEHVDQVHQLLTWLFDNNLELDRYVAEEKGQILLTDQDLEFVVREIGDAIGLLKELRHGPLQSSVLAEKLSMADRTVRRTLRIRDQIRRTWEQGSATSTRSLPVPCVASGEVISI